LAATNDIAERVASLELLPQLLDLTEITNRLDATDEPSVRITQDRGGHADGPRAPPSIDDERRTIGNRITGFQGVAEGTDGAADAGLEYFTASSADGFLSRNAREFLGRSIEVGDLPIFVDGEDGFSHAVKDDSPDAGRVCIHSPDPQSSP